MPLIFARQRAFAIRVNPDVDASTHPYISTGLHEHKFGVPLREAHELYRLGAVSRHLKAAGVSVHIGSQITDLAPFREAMERVASLVRAFATTGTTSATSMRVAALGISYAKSDEQFPREGEVVRDCANAPAAAPWSSCIT